MYRKQQNLIHVNVVFDHGGLGDNIAALPAIKYIHDTNPHVKIHLWAPNYFVSLAERSLPKEVIIRSFEQAKTKYNEKFAWRGYSIHQYTNLASHMVDHAFCVLVHKQIDDPHLKQYLPVDVSDIDISQFNLPDKYVVIPTGFTASAREFYAQYVNEITDWICSQGYIPVFLGKDEIPNGSGYKIQAKFDEKIHFDRGLNLLNKTSILETTKIIYGAKTIVGLDNGLLHIAGTCDIPIVGGFTTVEPKYRMPYRDGILGKDYYPVVPPESLKCRFCQSNWTFTYEFDFRKCFYDDYQCCKDLKAELYIEQLKKIL